MMFLALLFFIIFIVLIINEFCIFPYNSYFDINGNFWIRRYLFFKTQLDINSVIMATVIPMSFNYPWPYLQLWTLKKTYFIRKAGIFSYKSNLELLDRIIKINPKINITNKLQKYMEGRNKKGFYMIDEHLNGYIFLTATFLLALYFLFRSLTEQA